VPFGLNCRNSGNILSILLLWDLEGQFVNIIVMDFVQLKISRHHSAVLCITLCTTRFERFAKWFLSIAHLLTKLAAAERFIVSCGNVLS
jgi:hypothetical protein